MVDTTNISHFNYLKTVSIHFYARLKVIGSIWIQPVYEIIIYTKMILQLNTSTKLVS